jgi:membrane protein
MMTAKTYWQMLKETASAWIDDKAFRMGAALAYYSVFSMAPLLLIAIGIAGLVFGEQAARGEVLNQIRDTVGTQTATAIEEILAHAGQDGGGTWATIVGLAVLLFGASGVFVELQDALNTIWKVMPRPGRTVWEMVRERLLSFTVILGTGFLLLVSLILSAALAALGGVLKPAVSLPGGAGLWQALNFGLSFGTITLLFAMIYQILPDAEIAWRDVWVGALSTALLFTLGKYLIGLYLGHSTLTSAFGAAGSVILVLSWVYYSSLILLFGAEFTRVYARHNGSLLRPSRNAIRVPCPPGGEPEAAGAHEDAAAPRPAVPAGR